MKGEGEDRRTKRETRDVRCGETTEGIVNEFEKFEKATAVDGEASVV